MSNWNWLDFLIFLIFFVNTILGASRGATKEIISAMCLSAALIFVIKFTVPVAAFINSSPLIQNVLQAQIIKNFMQAVGLGPLTETLLLQLAFCLSLVLNFVAIFSVCEAIFYFSGFSEVFPFPYATLNRKVGAGLGCVRGYVFTLILLLVLTHIFTSQNNTAFNDKIIRSSFFGNLFSSSVQSFDRLIVEQDPDKYREIYKDKNLYNVQDVYKPVTQ